MQRSQRGVDSDNHVGRIIVRRGEWTIREMTFTPERIGWLGEQLKKYPSLTTDPTKQDPSILWKSVSSPQSYWTEVWKADVLVGILFLSDIQPGVDARVHPIFFDRSLSDKVEICLDGLRWAKHQFMLHRFTAALPEIYFATVRMAKKIGFVQEGTRREVYLINGRWCDEFVFGLLASEINDG